MIVPDCVQVEKIEELAQEVMRFSRDTLAVKLRFLNSSLSRLELLPSTWPLATDGTRMLYDPVYFNYYKVPALSHCALPSKIAIPHHRKATPTAKPDATCSRG